MRALSRRTWTGPSNAATDGVDVYVTSGMVDFVESNDELAYVIAHELAHVTADHVDKSKRNSLWGGVAGALVGTLIGGDALAGSMASAGARAGALRHSVDFEREADHIAVALILRAGFDPSVGSRFWERMARTANDAGYGLTHPPYGARSISLELSARQIGECAERLGGPDFLTWDTLRECPEATLPHPATPVEQAPGTPVETPPPPAEQAPMIPVTPVEPAPVTFDRFVEAEPNVVALIQARDAIQLIRMRVAAREANETITYRDGDRIIAIAHPSGEIEFPQR